MPATPDGVAGVLDLAADVVRRGWSQFHVALDVDGRPLESATDPKAVARCALGAIAAAATELDVDVAVRAAAAVEFSRYVTNGGAVAQWNADHGTSASYVGDKLHAAARELRRGGPAHVRATPPPVIGLADVPPEVAPRKVREFTPESALKADRGRLLGTLQMQRRSDAPEANIAATEGRIRSIDKRLREEHGLDMPPIPPGVE